MLRSRWSLLILPIVATILTPRDAQAYIDPATGSIVFQVVVAAALGAAFTLRRLRDRVTGAVRRVFRSKSPGE